LEVAGVAFVGVNVDFQLEARIHAAKHLIQHNAALTANLEFHRVTRLHAIKVSVYWTHVDVPHRADDALLHLEEPRWPH